MLNIFKRFRELKKLDKKEVLKPQYFPSTLIGSKIHRIFLNIDMLQDTFIKRNVTVRTPSISIPSISIICVHSFECEQPYVDFKIKTNLGRRRVHIDYDKRTFSQKLDYYDEYDNILMTIIEGRLKDTEPYDIALKNLAPECKWTPAKIIDAINEIYDIVTKEVKYELRKHDVLEMALHAYAYNRGIYVGEKFNGETDSIPLNLSSDIEGLIEQLKEFK